MAVTGSNHSINAINSIYLPFRVTTGQYACHAAYTNMHACESTCAHSCTLHARARTHTNNMHMHALICIQHPAVTVYMVFMPANESIGKVEYQLMLNEHTFLNPLPLKICMQSGACNQATTKSARRKPTPKRRAVGRRRNTEKQMHKG